MVSVDRCLAAGLDLSVIRGMIIGEPGTLVALEVRREGVHEAIAVDLVRSLPTVGGDAPSPVVGLTRSGEGEQRSVTHTPSPVGTHRGGQSRQSPGGAGEGVQQWVGVEGSKEGMSGEKVRAVCAFVAQRDHELVLEKGDVITVLRKHPSGWWEGTRGDVTGWFPSNHVEAVGAGVTAREGSNVSAHSLSIRSTVLANERSVATSCGSEGVLFDNGVPLEELTVDGVCAWLEGLDMGAYVSAFRANKIDGEMLAEVSEADLENDFGVLNKYHRRKIMARLLPARS